MRRLVRGFSLIELVVTLGIVGGLLALGASSFHGWIANARIRTAAEAIRNGLHLARAEAVRRNSEVSFQLTSSVDNSCVLSAPNTDASSDWVVTYALDDPTAACASPPLSEALPLADAARNPPPRIIRVRSAAEDSRNVIVNAGQTVFTFNGLGWLVEVPATNPVNINLTNPAAGNCAAAGGATRCLRVTVTLAGQVRICDPAYPISGSAPQRCLTAG